MNLFKSYLLTLLLSFSLLIPGVSLAVDTVVKDPIKPEINPTSLVATVNIEEARVLSQTGNTFNIAFSLSNRNGLQTGVKYGVALVAENANYIADEKVFDESITLYEHTTTKREVTYVAPTSLGGNYTLLLISKNENDLTLGTVSLGQITLTSSTKGLQILNDSCYLQVEDEKGGPRYTISQGVDIDESETLRLTCTAINNTTNTVSMTPYFQTKYFSVYGKVVPQIGGDYKDISFNKGEKKSFSVLLPKGNSPQSYNVTFSLNDATTSSNNIYVGYVIRGLNANILKLSLDKDYYRAGDTGTMSVLWSVVSGNLGRSNSKTEVAPEVAFNATITNNKGDKCSEVISQKLVRDSKDPQTHISFKTKTTCLNPIVSTSIIDDKGNTIYQKDFSFTSNPEKKEKQPLTLPIIIGLVLVVIIGIAISMKKKKVSNIKI